MALYINFFPASRCFISNFTWERWQYFWEVQVLAHKLLSQAHPEPESPHDSADWHSLVHVPCTHSVSGLWQWCDVRHLCTQELPRHIWSSAQPASFCRKIVGIKSLQTRYGWGKLHQSLNFVVKLCWRGISIFKCALLNCNLGGNSLLDSFPDLANRICRGKTDYHGMH